MARFVQYGRSPELRVFSIRMTETGPTPQCSGDECVESLPGQLWLMRLFHWCMLPGAT
jgi:hypothetical protein